jgi:hypothetical protein
LGLSEAQLTSLRHSDPEISRQTMSALVQMAFCCPGQVWQMPPSDRHWALIPPDAARHCSRMLAASTQVPLQKKGHASAE